MNKNIKTSINFSKEDISKIYENIMRPKPNCKDRSYYLNDAEEDDVPAKMPLVRMSCIENKIFLTVCKEKEEYNSRTYETIVEVALDAENFFQITELLKLDNYNL